MLQVWGDICVRSAFRVLTRVYVCIRICDLDGLLLRCCAVIETIPKGEKELFLQMYF